MTFSTNREIYLFIFPKNVVTLYDLNSHLAKIRIQHEPERLQMLSITFLSEHTKPVFTPGMC